MCCERKPLRLLPFLAISEPFKNRWRGKKFPYLHHNSRFYSFLLKTSPPTCWNKIRHLPGAPQQSHLFDILIFPPPQVCRHHPRPPDLATPGSLPGNTGGAGGLVTDRTALIWAPILGWGITNLLLHAWIGAAPFPDGEKGHRRAGPRGRSLQEMSQPPPRAGSAPRPPWILIPSGHVRAVTKPGLTAVTSSPLQPRPPEPEAATAQRPQCGPPHIPPGKAQRTPPPLQPSSGGGGRGRTSRAPRGARRRGARTV